MKPGLRRYMRDMTSKQSSICERSRSESSRLIHNLKNFFKMSAVVHSIQGVLFTNAPEVLFCQFKLCSAKCCGGVRNTILFGFLDISSGIRRGYLVSRGQNRAWFLDSAWTYSRVKGGGQSRVFSLLPPLREALGHVGDAAHSQILRHPLQRHSRFRSQSSSDPHLLYRRSSFCFRLGDFGFRSLPLPRICPLYRNSIPGCRDFQRPRIQKYKSLGPTPFS